MINLHIIGVQKAGTTALANFLHQHNDIYVVEGKEAHVFDHPDFEASPNKMAFAKGHYRQRLSGYAQQSVICDATPITLFNKRFLQHCVAFNPKAKFIVVLRDPIERAISHYHMSQNRGQESRCMLLAFLLEPWRLRHSQAQTSWPFNSNYRNHSYLSRGLYAQQLQTLFELVPKKQILVISQSDLKHNHQQTLNKVFAFVDVDAQQISSKTVFTTDRNTHHWTDPIAKLYAKIYFWLKRQPGNQWHQLLSRDRPYR